MLQKLSLSNLILVTIEQAFAPKDGCLETYAEKNVVVYNKKITNRLKVKVLLIIPRK